MKQLYFFFLLLTVNISFGQVVFFENFDELDDAITGTENSGNGVTWNTTCPGSVAATDYFKVQSGKLEARDTNTPAATWDTGVIDISACVGVSVSIIIEELSNMEECASCPGATGTGCIDWVKLEYNVDGGGWVDVTGVTCALTEAPGQMIQIGDIPGGGPITSVSSCIPPGTTLQIRVSCMCFAGAEVWRFDDITVSCAACTLPIELINFSATETTEGTLITWSTLSEISNDIFILERSQDGINFNEVKTINSAGNSNAKIDYKVIDVAPKASEFTYYRLLQYDFDGKSTYSKIISIKLQSLLSVYWTNQVLHYNLDEPLSDPIELNIYNLQGRLVNQFFI